MAPLLATQHLQHLQVDPAVDAVGEVCTYSDAQSEHEKAEQEVH